MGPWSPQSRLPSSPSQIWPHCLPGPPVVLGQVFSKADPFFSTHRRSPRPSPDVIPHCTSRRQKDDLSCLFSVACPTLWKMSTASSIFVFRSGAILPRSSTTSALIFSLIFSFFPLMRRHLYLFKKNDLCDHYLFCVIQAVFPGVLFSFYTLPTPLS